MLNVKKGRLLVLFWKVFKNEALLHKEQVLLSVRFVAKASSRRPKPCLTTSVIINLSLRVATFDNLSTVAHLAERRDAEN